MAAFSIARRETVMDQEIRENTRKFLRDFAFISLAALGVGLGVGGAAAMIIVFINSVGV
jgi:hypothetical protein